MTPEPSAWYSYIDSPTSGWSRMNWNSGRNRLRAGKKSEPSIVMRWLA